MPYHTGVLEDAPTGPDMILMPGGRAGRQTASFPPAGNFIEGDSVGTAGEVEGVDADAVEELFKVKVDDVRLFNVRGKVKRMGRYSGKRRDWRKAYVRLKEGEKAPDFIEGA